MTEHYSKTEKQYLSLTSVFKPFEQYSVYSDPDLPQIFSHNFVQLRASFPLNSLLSFLPSVSGLLNTNYIHLKASPQHTFPLVLKQSLVKNGFVVEDELFYSIQLDHWGKRAGHPLTGWGTKKALRTALLL